MGARTATSPRAERAPLANVPSRLAELPPPIRPAEAEPRGRPAREARALRPLSLGGVPIGFPVVQAALSGYSDGPMRIVARRLGAPYTVAEVMLERFVRELRRGRSRHHLHVDDEEHPVGGQLMGSDPADFAPAAVRLVEAGFDVVDINFGCPVRSALGGCRGGYHLGQPAVALEIVARVRAAVPAEVPVTVKLRRGIDAGEGSRERFFAILDGAFGLGVAAATVHARTVEQKYAGPSDWSFLAEVKRHVGARTILGSGDLFDAAACLAMLEQTGVDGVSVARGAIGNPWIFAQARALAEGRELPVPDLREQRRVLELQCELGLARERVGDVTTTMRKFGMKFARHHPREAVVRDAFAAVRDLAGWRAVLAEHYA